MGPGYPSLRDLVGVTFGAEFNEANQSIDGFIRMYDHTAGQWVTQLLDQLIADQQAGEAVPDVGLSLIFFGRHSWKEHGDSELKVTEEITHVESCDLVFGPAAQGRIRQKLSVMAAGRGSHEASNFTHQRKELSTMTPIEENVVAPEPDTLVAGPEQSPPVVDPVPAPSNIQAQLTALTAQVEQLSQALARAVEPSVVKGMGIPPSSPSPLRGAGGDRGLGGQGGAACRCGTLSIASRWRMKS